MSDLSLYFWMQFSAKCYRQTTLYSFSTGHTKTALSRRKTICARSDIRGNTVDLTVMLHVMFSIFFPSCSVREIHWHISVPAGNYIFVRRIYVRIYEKSRQISGHIQLDCDKETFATATSRFGHTLKRSEVRVIRNKRHAYLLYKMSQTSRSYFLNRIY